MAGILGIYGMIVSVILMKNVKFETGMTFQMGYANLAAGLATGLSSTVRLIIETMGLMYYRVLVMQLE